VSNSQIQQNVNNSSQTISLNEEYEKRDELIKYISTLKENIDKVGLESEKLSVITENVEVIESEIKKENTKPKVINECLGTIRNVLEGVAGSLIASGLIHQMGIFIK
jgi:low affinity Fe/Cu permease